MAADWIAWQLLDSAFPTGGFAHSGGLEAAVQHGVVTTAEQFIVFAQQNLGQAMRSTGPFIRAVFEGQEACELDELLDSATSNHVANRASRAQGRALLAVAGRAFPEMPLAPWGGDGGLPGHFAIVFGSVVRGMGFTAESAVRMFLFLTLRGLLSAAVRLGILGPMQAQRLQAQMAMGCEALVVEARSLSLEDAAQSAPLLDLWQGTQDRLYSRLFQS